MNQLLCQHEWTYIQDKGIDHHDRLTYHGCVCMGDSLFEFETDRKETLMYTSQNSNASYLLPPNAESEYIDKWTCSLNTK
jgi:hypothetical protein